MNQIREMVDLVREEVTAPGVNQARGVWQEDRDCCVGSRIAHALGVKSGMYLDGADEWASRMGLSRAHIIAMLQDAGAGHDPLGPTHWPECPSAVWRKLEDVELPPELSGRDLSGLNLARLDLRGADLHRTALQRSNLRNADLSNTDLSRARLRSACLIGANLRCANLAGADLRDADLTGADLAKANLRGTMTEGAIMAFTKTTGNLPGRRWDPAGETATRS